MPQFLQLLAEKAHSELLVAGGLASKPNRCGAHARTTGQPCKAGAMLNGRCRNHGGLSSGPKTPEGRKAIAEALRQRMATGGKERAQAGFQAWLNSGGREIRSKQAALRHWRRNPLYLIFGIIPQHLR